MEEMLSSAKEQTRRIIKRKGVDIDLVEQKVDGGMGWKFVAVCVCVCVQICLCSSKS